MLKRKATTNSKTKPTRFSPPHRFTSQAHSSLWEVSRGLPHLSTKREHLPTKLVNGEKHGKRLFQAFFLWGGRGGTASRIEINWNVKEDKLTMYHWSLKRGSSNFTENSSLWEVSRGLPHLSTKREHLPTKLVNGEKHGKRLFQAFFLWGGRGGTASRIEINWNVKEDKLTMYHWSLKRGSSNFTENGWYRFIFCCLNHSTWI